MSNRKKKMREKVVLEVLKLKRNPSEIAEHLCVSTPFVFEVMREMGADPKTRARLMANRYDISEAKKTVRSAKRYDKTLKVEFLSKINKEI